MDELEVKFFDIDPVEIMRKLEELHAEKVFSGPVFSVFMDSGKFDLRKSKRTLRLRSNDNSGIDKSDTESTLTFKKKRGDAGFRDHRELEIRIDDIEKCRTLFGRLGFGDYDKDVKNRISYKKSFGSGDDQRNIRFELDTPTFPFNDLGTYLEIETKRKRESDLKEAAAALGLPWEKSTSMSFIEYVERTKGIKPPYNQDGLDILLPYIGSHPELIRVRIPAPNFNQLHNKLIQAGFCEDYFRGLNVHAFDYKDLRLHEKESTLYVCEVVEDAMGVSADYPFFLRYLHESELFSPSHFICDDIIVGVYPSTDPSINVMESIFGIMEGLEMMKTSSFSVLRKGYKKSDVVFTYESNISVPGGKAGFLQVDAFDARSLSSILSSINL